MKNNVLKFDNSYEMQEAVCDNRLDEEDYIGALQTIKYCRNDEVSLKEKKLAEIYMEMQLFDLALFHWFKLIEISDEKLKYIAYDGLGICYINQGENNLAQYYFNLSLENMDDTAELDFDMLDYVRSLDDETNTTFKIVHPPELADYSDTLLKSKYFLRNQRYDEAIEILDTVDKRSSSYIDAANDKIIAYLLKEDYVSAEVLAEEIILKDKHNISALSSLQSIYLQTDRKEKATEIAEGLYKIKSNNIDDLYKTASVFCEQNMPYKALEKYKLLEREAPFDKDILYTIAALYYNIGHLYESNKYLRHIVDIYDDLAAEYYLKKVNKSLFKGTDISEIEPFPYVLRLPVEEKKRIVSIIADINSKKDFKIDENINIYKIFDWCLTNDEIKDEILELMTINAIAKFKGIENDNYIKELLIRTDINDSAKFELIGRLCEKNIKLTTGIVMCNIYKKIDFLPVNIKKKGKELFLKAYGLCFSKFAMIEKKYGEKLNEATEILYYIFVKEELFKSKYKYQTLAAAIYLITNIKEIGRSVKKIAELFDADYTSLKEIMVYVKEYKGV
jgi:tetratricopeptide (TPR) repeat protein